MRCILFLLLFIIVSCASMQAKYSTEFDPYIKDFEKNCKTKVILPIKLSDLPADTLGRCNNFKTLVGGLYLPQEFRSIEIDRKYWKKASYNDREATMLHEFGHCVLNLEHNEKMIGQFYLLKRPETLMYPYNFHLYTFYRDQYRKEFYKHCK